MEFTKKQLSQIDFETLKKACLEIDISLVGKKKHHLIEPFLTKIEILPKTALTDFLINTYNQIVEVIEVPEETKEEIIPEIKEEKNFPAIPELEAIPEIVSREIEETKASSVIVSKEKILHQKNIQTVPFGAKLSRYTRVNAIVEALRIGGTESEVALKADELYVAHGGLPNLKEAYSVLRYGVRFLETLGILDRDKGIFRLKILVD